MTNLTEAKTWNDLLQLCAEFKHDDFELAQLFENDGRFSTFSINHDDLFLDFSKNIVTAESLEALTQLAKEMLLPEAIDAMFSGEKVNITERRAALHTALRIPEEENTNSEIIKGLQQMDLLVTALHSDGWRGCSGQRITDVVSIGIGGSNLGPAFVCDALSDYSIGKLNLHFVSNIDPADLTSVIADLNPATTLFIVASKSFTTMETIQNANAAKGWLMAFANSSSAVKNHFVGITMNSKAATEFGIARENLFPIWNWIGGRYSLWSAIGLPIAILIGMENFRQLLRGANSMDKHFRTAELKNNMPVIMGLLSVWYTNFFNARSHAVIPYSQKLQQFPAYLQQLHMESLGKSVTKNSEPVATNTGDVLWGSAGTNAQHSYFQLLHQGTEFIPVDFIAAIKPNSDGENANINQKKLLANCLSQSLALMRGCNYSSNPHEQVSGNKPSNTLLLNKLDPYNLGSLIALYEHKTYVQSVIWQINAFDQWGVELGKKVADEIFGALEKNSVIPELDESTDGLINRIKAAL